MKGQRKVGFFYHEDFLKHRYELGDHPEGPPRLEAILGHLKKTGLLQDKRLIQLPPQIHDAKWIAEVHSADHLSQVETACEEAFSFLDSDTYVNKDSLHVAELAVSTVLTAIDAVMEGTLDRAFCAVRPPGHHAETHRPMGFCLYNNIAVAARYLQKHHHLKKIFIVDWDVHHGNGTQEIFYSDPSVFYFSTHQYPLYPGTGADSETGEGPGLGTTLNIPLPEGSDDETILSAYQEHLVPAVQKFRPDFILISAGLDAHRDDPLSSLAVTEVGFQKITALVKELAETYCQGRIVSVLEGGYDLQALGPCVEVHLRELLEETPG